MTNDNGGEAEIRIVLADDQPIIRQGLSFIINMQPDMHTVGEAGDGREVEAVVAAAKPDLVLMDIQMPGRSGIDATRAILAASPEIKIILLTTFDIQAYVADGIRAGAVGYLLKDADTRQLLEGIRAAHRGAAVYQSATAGKAMADAIRPDPSRLQPGETGGGAADLSADPLTDKELEVLQMMAYGRRNSEIAASLFISEGTVKTHVHRILGKLLVEDRTQAVVLALRSGLVE